MRDRFRWIPTSPTGASTRFSGGEKKRHEIVQLELLNPRFAILDETNSGLDIDALRIVAGGVDRFSAQGDRGVLLITHYTRILRYIKPDYVHVFIAGRVAEQGGHELAERLDAEDTTAMYARLRRLGRNGHHVAQRWAGVSGHRRSLRSPGGQSGTGRRADRL